MCCYMVLNNVCDSNYSKQSYVAVAKVCLSLVLLYSFKFQWFKNFVIFVDHKDLFTKIYLQNSWLVNDEVGVLGIITIHENFIRKIYF